MRLNEDEFLAQTAEVVQLVDGSDQSHLSLSLAAPLHSGGTGSVTL